MLGAWLEMDCAGDMSHTCQRLPDNIPPEGLG